MSKWAVAFMVVVLLGALALVGCQSDSSAAPAEGEARSRPVRLSGSDQEFIRNAALGGKMEVEMGQVGVDRGASQALRTYGARLVSDHQQANRDLTELASRKDLTVPRQLDAEHRRMIDMLSNATGRDFDRDFIRHAVEQHEKTIVDFERASRTANDPEVRAFATRTLPTLRQHLAQARDIAGELGLRIGNRPRTSP